MSNLSVRAIVLSSLVAEKSVEEIVAQIRIDRPDSQAGVPEVKWYISKMKKEEFLDKAGIPTPKGIQWVSKIAFRVSKTQKTAESGVLLKTHSAAKKTVEEIVVQIEPIVNTRLVEFEENVANMKGKELTQYFKELCKKLGVPFYKKVHSKDENKAEKIERLRVQIIENFDKLQELKANKDVQLPKNTEEFMAEVNNILADV